MYKYVNEKLRVLSNDVDVIVQSSKKPIDP